MTQLSVTVPCPVGLPKDVFEGIMDADLSDVVALMKDHEHITDDNLIAEMEKGWKLYLLLLRVYPNEKFVISAPIDIFGHTHKLDTREFESFGIKFMGGKLHHKPTKSPNERTELLPQYKSRTLPMLKKLFGEHITPAMWPENECVCTWDVDTGGDDYSITAA